MYSPDELIFIPIPLRIRLGERIINSLMLCVMLIFVPWAVLNLVRGEHPASSWMWLLGMVVVAYALARDAGSFKSALSRLIKSFSTRHFIAFSESEVFTGFLFLGKQHFENENNISDLGCIHIGPGSAGALINISDWRIVLEFKNKEVDTICYSQSRVTTEALLQNILSQLGKLGYPMVLGHKAGIYIPDLTENDKNR